MSAFSDEILAMLNKGDSPRNLMPKIIAKLIELETTSDAANAAAIDALEARMDDAEDDIADHESRLDVLEA